MKNFILGFIIAASGSVVAVEYHQDGSITLTPDEVNQVEINFYHLRTNFDIAVERVRELQEKLDALEKAKCI